MKLLITGGLGFIGRASIPRFLGAGCDEIRVLDNVDASVHGDGAAVAAITSQWPAQVRFTRGSLADRELLDSLLRDVDAVLHLAALTSVPGSQREAARYSDVNISGTGQLVELLPHRLDVGRPLVDDGDVHISLCQVGRNTPADCSSSHDCDLGHGLDTSTD